MNTFSISQAASSEIQRIFDRSECLEPVATLYEAADSGHLIKAMSDGTKTTEELTAAIVGKRFEEVASALRQLKMSLRVWAAERADYPVEYLHEVSGITFGIDARIVEALHEYCLTFEDGQFFFKGMDNARHTLSSIPRRTK
jgi:hypothetical protein